MSADLGQIQIQGARAIAPLGIPASSRRRISLALVLLAIRSSYLLGCMARRNVAGTVPKGNIDGSERRYRAQGQTVLNRNSRRAEAGNYSVAAATASR